MFFGWRLLDTKLSLKFFVNFLPSLYSADIDVAALYSYSPFDQFHKTIGYYTPTLSNDQSNSSNVKYDITATANSYSSFSSHVHCEFIRLLLLWHSVYLQNRIVQSSIKLTLLTFRFYGFIQVGRFCWWVGQVGITCL